MTHPAMTVVRINLDSLAQSDWPNQTGPIKLVQTDWSKQTGIIRQTLATRLFP